MQKRAKTMLFKKDAWLLENRPNEDAKSDSPRTLALNSIRVEFD